MNLIDCNEYTETITTANGKVKISPIYCEVTNKQIGWQTRVPIGNYSPAFISLKVVSKKGIQKISTIKNDTF